QCFSAATLESELGEDLADGFGADVLEGRPIHYFAHLRRGLSPYVSTNWPIVILDGMAWGLIITSGTTPSTVKGMSSWGTRSPMTPFCPWREANLSPSSGLRKSLPSTLIILFLSLDSVRHVLSMLPCS